MRAINVYFEDLEIKELEAKKKDRSWHDFIIEEILEERFEDGH